MFTPLRMCVACRQMKPKNELIRLAKNGNTIIIDEKKRMQGRGAYLCDCKACVRLAQKKKALQRQFKCAVEDTVYEDVEKHCDG